MCSSTQYTSTIQHACKIWANSNNLGQRFAILVAPPPPGSCNPIETDGTAKHGNIENEDDEVCFTFTAVAGRTYQLETEMGSGTNELSDSTMELVDPLTGHSLVENDDDERATG